MEQPQSKPAEETRPTEIGATITEFVEVDTSPQNDARPMNPRRNTSLTPARGMSKRLRDFMDAGADRHIELFLAFAITFFAAAQWVTGCRNNTNTSIQVDRLIGAANRVGGAADSFSMSASHISNGVSDAVAKLDAQAHASQKTADAAKAANDLAVEQVRARVHSTGRKVFRIPFYTDRLSAEWDFKNIGKLPAYGVSSVNSVAFRDAPPTKKDIDSAGSVRGGFGDLDDGKSLVLQFESTVSFKDKIDHLPGPLDPVGHPGKPTFYVFGSITYTSLNVVHHEYFCAYVVDFGSNARVNTADPTFNQRFLFDPCDDLNGED